MPSLNTATGSVLGPLFIGLVFSSILYGVICLQVYSYFTRHCEKDRPFLKFFIVMLLILDTLQEAFLVHGYYIVAVANFGNIAGLRTTPWSLRIQALLGIVVAATTQQFYAWRIYKLNIMAKTRIFFPILIVIMTFVELAIGIVTICVVRSSQHPHPNNTPLVSSTPLAILGLSIEVACDIIITLCMVYLLVIRGSKVMRSSTSPTTTLAAYCITSGSLTLIFATLCLVTSVVYSGSNICAPFWCILVRLYSCSFMAILNSRDHLRTAFRFDSDPDFATFSVSVSMPTPPPSTKTTSNVFHGFHLPNLFVKKLSTLQITEDGGLPHNMPDSAAIVEPSSGG
ncbi:hypothetical protein BGW80DRAFT_472 [Lactifluus volemus]|nr:hypothetical protein BGW80DRAFT_472 [Lactifluus volemus]